MITPQVDHFNERTDDPYWNESSCQLFFVPERKLLGKVYFWHKPNLKCTGTQISIWDDQFVDRPDITYFDYREYNPLPPEADMFDFTLDSGLTARLIEPLKTYEFEYAGDGCRLDLRLEATTPPYERLNAAGDEGSMSEEFAGFADRQAASNAGHYSMGVRCTGTMTIEDEIIDVDCMTFRDHSWGPRNAVGRYMRGSWNYCFTDTSCFDVWAISPLPAETDPLVGTTERAVMGMYYKDGQLSPIVDGVHRTLEYDARDFALRGEIEATDKLGRTLTAEGTYLNWHRWMGHGDICDVVSLAEWNFDGITAHGLHDEFRTMRQNRQLVRGLRGAVHA